MDAAFTGLSMEFMYLIFLDPSLCWDEVCNKSEVFLDIKKQR